VVQQKRVLTSAPSGAEELRTLIDGEVFLPGDEGYARETAGWNLLVEHNPSLVVVPFTPEDVALAVRFAAAESLPVAVHATGHGPSLPADGCVFISTRRMTSLGIDVSAATARIGPGVKWEPVIEQAGHHGLGPLVGSTPDVSAVGYLTGGGLPVLGRRYGFSADHVRSLEMVTADGEIRHASDREHPELFWAVRGGKGNFGIVTSISTGLLRLSWIYGGGLIFPGEKTREVLRTWIEWTSSQPDEMSSSVALARFPDAPGVPDPLRGEFVVHLRIAYTGSAEEGETLVRPLRALGPSMDAVTEIPYTRIGEVHNDPLEPVPVRDRGTLLGPLDEAAADRVTELAGPKTQMPPGLVELRHLGGALARPPALPSALGNRGAAFSFVAGFVTMPDEVERIDAIQRDLFGGMAEWDTGGALPNFLGADSDPESVKRAYEDADYERLREIKAAYDPYNLFRINHNIPPAA
jgi:FAD/FMN-containing dehydrogenase